MHTSGMIHIRMPAHSQEVVVMCIYIYMYIHLTKKKTTSTVPGCAMSQEQAEYDLVGARALECTGLEFANCPQSQ